jgi:hypothetical protein
VMAMALTALGRPDDDAAMRLKAESLPS